MQAAAAPFVPHGRPVTRRGLHLSRRNRSEWYNGDSNKCRRMNGGQWNTAKSCTRHILYCIRCRMGLSDSAQVLHQHVLVVAGITSTPGNRTTGPRPSCCTSARVAKSRPSTMVPRAITYIATDDKSIVEVGGSVLGHLHSIECPHRAERNRPQD